MAKAKKKTVNKSDFVRSAGDIPAKEVVQRAKARGIKLTERYVYVIRSSDKAKARRRGATFAGPRSASTRRGRAGSARNGFGERELRVLICVVGLATAKRVIEEIEASLR